MQRKFQNILNSNEPVMIFPGILQEKLSMTVGQQRQMSGTFPAQFHMSTASSERSYLRTLKQFGYNLYCIGITVDIVTDVDFVLPRGKIPNVPFLL